MLIDGLKKIVQKLNNYFVVDYCVSKNVLTKLMYAIWAI